MTREEIIDGLEIYTAGRLNKDRVHITVKELQKFIDAIKALEQEPCEDAISRQNTLAEFKRLYFDNDTVIRCAELVLGGMPSITPQTKKGHWIMHEKHRECSECKVWLLKDMPRNNYCPNCGAKMEVEI